MVQSDHFSSELARVPSDQVHGALPCVPGEHGTFNLTAEARYVHWIELLIVCKPTDANCKTMLKSCFQEFIDYYHGNKFKFPDNYAISDGKNNNKILSV